MAKNIEDKAIKFITENHSRAYVSTTLEGVASKFEIQQQFMDECSGVKKEVLIEALRMLLSKLHQDIIDDL